MNLAFIGKGEHTTMSEQRTDTGYAITNGMASWHEEIKMGKRLKAEILETLDYHDLTETIDKGTLHVFSNGETSKGIIGLQWLYAKVAYKLHDTYPEIAFEWIQETDPEAYAFYLGQMDIILTHGSVDESLVTCIQAHNKSVIFQPIAEHMAD